MADKKFTPAAAFSDKPYQPIPMTAVESNQVAAIGYDAASRTLAVTFARGPGHVFHYPNVGADVHAAFMAAESKGTFFGTRIKSLAFDKFPAVVATEAPTVADAPAALTPAAVAARLHGNQYGRDSIPLHVQAAAKTAGLVIVCGASDDLMELYGAIRDEVGCHDGRSFLLDAKGVLKEWDNVESEEEAQAYLDRKRAAHAIEAIWSPEGEPEMSWAYKIDIPHATFDVMEDGEIYCRGLVFSLAALGAKATASV